MNWRRRKKCSARWNGWPENNMPARGLHVHIEPDTVAVVETLINTDLVPHLKGRSAHYIVHELMKGTEHYKTAAAQIASERHPRPTGKR